jgi:photosystem II stability/assembly factor-like uncharacterized protein
MRRTGLAAALLLTAAASLAPLSSAGEPRAYTVALGQSIRFASPAAGWLADAHGIATTANGGATWRRTFTAAPAGGLDAVDAQHVWALSAHGLLASRDGGRSWRRLASAPLLDSLSFVTARDGFALTYRPLLQLGSLVETHDGGAHWAAASGHQRASGACFASLRRGWLASPTDVSTTSDGGRSWKNVLMLHGFRGERWHDASVGCSGSAAYVLLTGGVAAGSEAYRVVRTLDGGAHWHAILGPAFVLGTGLQSIDAYADGFDVISPGRAVFAGSCPACLGLGTERTVLVQAGARSVSTTQPFSGSGEAAVSFTDDTHGWLITARLRLKAGRPVSDTALYRTSNSGRSWRLARVVP